MLKKIYWFFSAQLGLNPLLLMRSIKGLPRYLLDLMEYRRGYRGALQLVPCLHDWYEEGGSTKNEYFWQDLLVARMIFANAPRRHVDVGSRVDGFVAHVASFREIEVFDVRSISTIVPGIIFRQADLMTLPQEFEGYCDSLSCLHALEHFGLGRYGDPVDPLGYERGLENMARLLMDGGVFYLSVPIGVERVEFNANRVFDPRLLLKTAKQNSLELVALKVISQGCQLKDIEPSETNLNRLSMDKYALGIFTFKKIAERKT